MLNSFGAASLPRNTKQVVRLAEAEWAGYKQGQESSNVIPYCTDFQTKSV